jgi:hypothetical protein
MTARTRGRAFIEKNSICTRWSGRAGETSRLRDWRADSCARDAEDDASCWSFSPLPNRSARTRRSERECGHSTHDASVPS